MWQQIFIILNLNLREASTPGVKDANVYILLLVCCNADPGCLIPENEGGRQTEGPAGFTQVKLDLIYLLFIYCSLPLSNESCSLCYVMSNVLCVFLKSVLIVVSGLTWLMGSFVQEFHSSVSLVTCGLQILAVWFHSPVNFLDHTQHKGLAVAVFGVLLCKLWGLIVSPDPLPFTTDTRNKREGGTQLFIAFRCCFSCDR